MDAAMAQLAPTVVRDPAANRRRFTVLDGMALIGATAVGFGLTRLIFGDLIRESQLGPMATWDKAAVMQLAVVGMAMATPTLACLSAAMAMLSMGGPRRSRRRLARRPGFAAAIGAAASFALGLPYILGLILVVTGFQGSESIPSWDELRGGLLQVMYYGHGVPGLVVVACWAVQGSIGQWRPSRDWLDRTGRALGVVWIALLVGSPIAIAIAFL